MRDNGLINVDFQPVADVTNNFFNKISDAVGWIVQPKGARANRADAEKFLKEEILSNKNIPLFYRAALASQVKILIKQYINQNDIVQLATKYLTDVAKPELVDDQWLLYFFDKCKNVEGSDIQALWGKLLAGECEQQGTVSRALIHSLSIMDTESANKFKTLCSFAVNITEHNKGLNFTIPLLFTKNGKDYDDIYQRKGLHIANIYDLETCGLIHINERGFIREYTRNETVDIEYGNFFNSQKMHRGDYLSVGSVMLTRAGLELLNFTEVKPFKGFEIYLNRMIRK